MREGRRLETLIDDLAWLARHDEHRAEIQSVDVDLDDLLFDEGHRVRLLSELRVDTTKVQPTRVIGDPAMMKRMIRNVVDNATRYATEELRFDSHYDGDVRRGHRRRRRRGHRRRRERAILRAIRPFGPGARASLRRDRSWARDRDRDRPATRRHLRTSSRPSAARRSNCAFAATGERTAVGDRAHRGVRA